MKDKKMIKDIVLDYCEVSAEYSLLTVDAFDLDEMVEKIKQLVKKEIRDYVVAHKKEKLGLFFSNR